MSASDNIDLVKVKDSRLMVQEKIKLPVYSGASSVASQRVQANTKSISGVSFNVITPNESTVIAREVMMTNVFDVAFQYPIVAGGKGKVMQLGTSEAPSPFPFQLGFGENIQCTINSASFSSPIGDIFERWLLDRKSVV